MEITLEDLKAIHDLNYKLCGCWSDIELIDGNFIDECEKFLNEFFRDGVLEFSEEVFQKHLPTLAILRKYENAKFSHSDPNCRTDYDWDDFKTTIELPNGSKYILEGDFSPASGYIFKNLKQMSIPTQNQNKEDDFDEVEYIKKALSKNSKDISDLRYKIEELECDNEIFHEMLKQMGISKYPEGSIFINFFDNEIKINEIIQTGDISVIAVSSFISKCDIQQSINQHSIKSIQGTKIPENVVIPLKGIIREAFNRFLDNPMDFQSKEFIEKIKGLL